MWPVGVCDLPRTAPADRPTFIKGKTMEPADIQRRILEARKAWSAVDDDRNSTKPITEVIDGIFADLRRLGIAVPNPPRAEITPERIAAALTGGRSIIPHWHREYHEALNQAEAALANVQPERSKEADPPTARVQVNDSTVVVDGKAYAVPEALANFFAVLLDGGYHSAADAGIRTRQIERLPDQLKNVLDSDGGKGTRIKPEWLG